jgi:hypothetical protein
MSLSASAEGSGGGSHQGSRDRLSSLRRRHGHAFVERRPVVDPDELFLWFAEADGVVPPRPVNKVVTTYAKGGARRLIEITTTEPFEVEDVEPGLPPISGGSDADLPGGGSNWMCHRHGPPHPPTLVAPHQSFMWGSSQSRSALPIRLMVSVVMKMASPGKAAIHHEFSM